MKSGALILGTVVSVILLSVAGALYTMVGGGGQPYRSSINLVRDTQQLSSAWSVEVGRAKSDPFADFDSLAAFIPRMARFTDNLSDAIQELPALSDRTAGDVYSYLSALDAQEERIERFKTGYAVVRNSSRYFPIASANVARQAEAVRNERLAQNASKLVYQMNSYLEAPTDSARARLVGDLQQLVGESATYPLPLANAVANLISHAELLLARQEPTEKLFQEATSGDISSIANRVVAGLEFEQRRQEMQATYYERGIMAVLAVLALFWVGLALQQRARSGAAAVRGQPAPAAPPGQPVPAPLSDHPAAWPAEAVLSLPAGVRKAGRGGVPAVVLDDLDDLDDLDLGSVADDEPLPGEDLRQRAGPRRDGGQVPIAAEEQSPSAAPAEASATRHGGAGAAAQKDAPDAAATAITPPGESTGSAAGDGSNVESEILHAFLAECVADTLAAATERITVSMDHLRQTQDGIRITLEDRDADPDSFDAIRLDQDIETATAVASSVRREANTLADLARRFGSFSRMPNGVVEYEMVDVNACIDEVIAALGAETDGTIARDFGDIPEIFASRAEVRMLVGRFVENSMFAIRGLGRRAGVIKLDTMGKDGEIQITVIDNGVGIASDKHQKIFEPFYTSREGAMGIGLTLADHLVKKYKGAIAVNSLPGHGTVIRITLPVGMAA